ncbi:hypothetical protein L2E82_34324 [Cichorium intybus]|uniref:Uncharacterized protein n=1 Tax=Cichorium intybus TaxID=13427 RepID=A0ACB9BM12_CICIN|nr:hypothetical protein L2E82_34324 [Cichorium intybus]
MHGLSVYQITVMRYLNWPLSYVTSYIRESQLRNTGPFNLGLLRGASFTAHNLFDKSPESHVVAIHDNEYEVLTSFIHGNRLDKKPSKFELCTALNCCAKTQNPFLGSQIHAKILNLGLDQNLYINSSLVNVYAKSGAIVDAMRVFNEMESHDQVSWTSIISGLSQNGHGKEALCLFKQMLKTQVVPNSFTYVSVISGCTEQESVSKCVELLHAHVMKLGHESNKFVISSLIDNYSKSGKIDKAVILFEAFKMKDDILLNSMISAYSHNLQGENALKLFTKMHNANVSLSEHALTSVLDACGALTILQQGKQMHALVTKMGSNQNTFVIGALINMYSKCGNINEASQVFDQTLYKNNILWTSMMSAYAQSGRGLEALEIFDMMEKENHFTPDHVCFTVVLTACNHSGLLEKGIYYFEKMKSHYNLVPEVDQYACLIDLHARKGDLESARKVFDEMPYNANAVMWSSFLSSCKEYGNVELGREAAYKLFELEPNSPVPYLILADIYNGAGLWSEVRNIKKLMNENGVRKCVVGWSWVEVDNEVHVFSVGDSCHPRSEEIYFELRKINFEMMSKTVFDSFRPE